MSNATLIVIETHGRSIYKTNISHLRALKDHDNSLKVFAIGEVKYSARQGSQNKSYDEPYERTITYDVSSPNASTGQLIIFTGKGKKLLTQSISLQKGLASYEYDMSIDPNQYKDLQKYLNDGNSKEDKVTVELADNGKVYLQRGEYMLKIEMKGKSSEVRFVIN